MYFGAHVSSSGGIEKAVGRAAAIGAECVQVFVQSPRMWRMTNHSDESIAAFRAARAESGIHGAVVHASYLINVASVKPDLRAKSSDALVATMQVADRLGLDAAILHPGSFAGDDGGFDAALPRLAESLLHALAQSEDTWLLLENSAGQGSTIGRTTEELARIVESCGAPDRLGICLDTCHWYVSGVDVTDQGVLDGALDDVDAAIGLDRLRALHVNDSAAGLGSNRDRHANIGEGELGAGLATFLRHPRLQGLCAYLEVPGDGDGPDRAQLDAVRALHDG